MKKQVFMPGMRTSQTGLELIKSFEGFRPRSVSLGPDRGWVIGYGHTKSARPNLRVAEKDAEDILREYELPVIEQAVTEAVYAPLNQNEFDALMSFVFNIGIKAFHKSDVLSRLNSGEKLSAASAMAAWRKARIDGRLIVIDALVRRRAVEIALFLERPSGRLAAPTALLRPQLDIAASIMAPRERAVIVEENQNGDMVGLRTRSDPSAPPANDTTDVMPEDQTAPEAAARAVTERLTRILGETSAPAHIDKDISVDEIMAAVSELADPAPEDDELLEQHQQAQSGAQIVNDLESPADVPAGQIERAIAVHAEVEAEDRFVSVMTWVPYAFMSFLGFVIFSWGVFKIVRMASSERVLAAGQMTAGPFLLLVGSILFVVMGYYLYRVIKEAD